MEPSGSRSYQNQASS
uniref:Uncharacterized protein n=1 Tax=Anguilla anguilla TaxID=7936 RepID=A0A0E9VGZ3_ANGAN